MRLLYVSLHGTAEGQTGWADVDEVVAALRARGWHVSLHQPPYVGSTPPSLARRIAETLMLQARLMPRLRGFDAVYIRSHTIAFPLALAARLLSVPVIQECNGPYEDMFIAWPGLRPLKTPLIWMTRAQYRWADGLITVTDGLAAWLERETRKHRVVTIPNGANVDMFCPGAATTIDLPCRYVVFFGSLAAWQGIDTMLAAIRTSAWPSDTSLVIAGDGAMRATVETAESGGRVVYLGSLPQTDLPGIVAGSMASLILKDDPAHAASGLSPLKLYESMAAGVPIIVSDLPGLADVAEQTGCGITVPAGDAEAVARAVRVLSEDAGLRDEMGRRARSTAVKEFSWTAVADRTAQVIQDAVDGR